MENCSFIGNLVLFQRTATELETSYAQLDLRRVDNWTKLPRDSFDVFLDGCFDKKVARERDLQHF